MGNMALPAPTMSSIYPFLLGDISIQSSLWVIEARDQMSGENSDVWTFGSPSGMPPSIAMQNILNVGTNSWNMEQPYAIEAMG